jgi:serine/threonine-protein kinase RsbW
VDDRRSTRIPAQLVAVRELAEVVREAARQAGLSDAGAIDLELAIVEAANNIVLHGYAGRAGEIEMLACLDGGLGVELRDTGIPIPPERLADAPHAAVDAEHGRGLAIIRACVDRMEYASAGGVNCLTLFKAREG